ncbi:hypothetical protein K474DRAFT_1706662 [Panus rudis PR-1116 ss-1]|nr:hypothetical protein K474DRAFT_1706662 [Panus rudis PR-1116 ss-1]
MTESWPDTKSEYNEVISPSRQIVAAAAGYCNDLTGSLIPFLRSEVNGLQEKQAKSFNSSGIESDKGTTTTWSQDFDLFLQQYQSEWVSFVENVPDTASGLTKMLIQNPLGVKVGIFKDKLIALTKGFHALVNFYISMNADIRVVQKQLGVFGVPNGPSWALMAGRLTALADIYTKLGSEFTQFPLSLPESEVDPDL